MLYIDDSNLIGKGMDRECYTHPKDSTKCIKITVSGNYKQSKAEISYYRMLEKRGVSLDRLAAFHGVIQTTRGQGLVFSLVLDYNEVVSKPLSHYLSTGTYKLYEFKDNLESLKNYLLKERIIIRDLKSTNILFQKFRKNNGKLVIIDGLGNNDFIPISSYISFLTRKKIIRKWTRFEHSLLRQYEFE